MPVGSRAGAGANRKVAKIGADVRPGGAEARLPGEQVAFRVDLIENAISSSRIVLGDIHPEFDEVLFTAFCPGEG